jgi:hypothetical protein
MLPQAADSAVSGRHGLTTSSAVAAPDLYEGSRVDRKPFPSPIPGATQVGPKASRSAWQLDYDGQLWLVYPMSVAGRQRPWAVMSGLT